MPDNTIREMLDEEAQDFIHIFDVYTVNTDRLVRLFSETTKRGDAISVDEKEEYLAYVNDICRAAIVFLHSALETLLRGVIGLKLKYDGDISTIPLAGYAPKEKFTLLQLVQFRGHTVDDVVEQSIDDYLYTLSFNNARDIAAATTKIGIPQDTLRPYYEELDAMIARRHQIVHEADLKRKTKPFELESVDMDAVVRWAANNSRFVKEFMLLTIEIVFPDRATGRLKDKGLDFESEEIRKYVTAYLRPKLPDDSNNVPSA